VPTLRDGTDVNAADRSSDGKYLVTADDYGLVKLFANPSVVEGSGGAVQVELS
jgi:hypothetical protein